VRGASFSTSAAPNVATGWARDRCQDNHKEHLQPDPLAHLQKHHVQLLEVESDFLYLLRATHRACSVIGITPALSSTAGARGAALNASTPRSWNRRAERSAVQNHGATHLSLPVFGEAGFPQNYKIWCVDGDRIGSDKVAREVGGGGDKFGRCKEMAHKQRAKTIRPQTSAASGLRA
jgi:hypothetical protein